MPEFRVAVDPETAEALRTETDLLGFEDGEGYLSWIVANRAAIEQGTEAAELLDAYRKRIAALEHRLAAEGVDPAAVDGEAVSDANPTTARAGESASDATDATAPGASDGGTSQTTFGSETREPADRTESSVDTIETSADRSPSIGGGTGDTEPNSHAGTDSDEPRAASDGGTATDEITSMHLRPERVQRVSEDPVTEDADSLANVETNRLDELSRRAVAETRQRLDRDVETGLDYSSSAALDEDGVRPGEDLADLDSIEVPGRTAEVVECRRIAVGRALAFLHDRGRARRRDFVEELFEECPAGYESTAGWWRCVREALKQVDAVEGGQVWRYEG